jgi:hypothetical protein
MFAEVAPETLGAVAYAGFAALAAVALDAAARHAHRRMEVIDAIAVAMVGFGGLVILVVSVLNHSGADLLVSSAGFVLSMVVATYLASDFRAGAGLGLDSPRSDGIDSDADQWRPRQSFSSAGHLDPARLPGLDTRQIVDD